MAPTKGKSIQCVVQSIDSMIALNIGPDTTGQQLLDLIFVQLSIFEKHWFGLMYHDVKDNVRWLDPKKKVNLKEVKPFLDTSSHFKFTIRYFPENMKMELIQDVVKALFFKYELSRLVTDPDTDCLPEHRILFAVAYACLVSYDHSKISCEEVIRKKFDRLFPSHIMKQFELSKQEWIDAIMPSLDLAKSQHYIEPLTQALESMEQSPMHGISYYQIHNKNGTDLLLGIDCYGLTIYKKQDRVNPCVAFHWQEICNVSYTGKAFHIRPLAKDDPELVIYTRSARQNDEILSLIAGNHLNYLRRRQGDADLELEVKAAKQAQEVNAAERKRFEKQQEANFRYESNVQKVLNAASDNKGAQLEEEFTKTKVLMQQQIEEARIQAEKEKERTLVAEQEADYLRKQSQELELQLQKQQKDKEDLALMESQRLSMEESRVREVEALTEKLKQLEIKHKDDLERLAVMEKTGTLKKAGTPTKDPGSYEDSKKKKNAEIKANLAKVGTLLKQRNVGDNTAVSLIQQNASEGKDKFATLKMLRKNNTKARVDEFESF